MDKLDDYLLLNVLSYINNKFYCYCKSKNIINFSMTCKYYYNLLNSMVFNIKLTMYKFNYFPNKKYIMCNIHNFQEIEYYESQKIN